MDLAVAVTLLGGAALGALWIGDLRRHRRRTAGRASEWDARPEADDDLWTSSVRCVRCQAGGVILSREGGGLWHTCLSCGHRDRRQTHA